MPEILDFVPDESGSLTVPVSGVGRWLVAVPQSQLNIADSNPTNPALIPATRPTLVRAVQQPSGELFVRGTTLRMRLIYPEDMIDMNTPPFVVVRVYGAEDYIVDASGVVLNQGHFGPLRNLDNDLAVAFRADFTTDPRLLTTYQGARVVPPDNTAHSWDCDGCTAFRIANRDSSTSWYTERGSVHRSKDSLTLSMIPSRLELFP